MRIGFDLDGVLYDFHTALYTELVALHKLDVDFDTFWTKTILEYNDIELYNILHILPTYSSMVPENGVVDTVNYLRNKYGSVYYITARDETLRYVTVKYLTYWGFPDVENLVLIDSDSKIDAVNENGIDVFVEDRSKYALELKDICAVFLVSKPWNTNVRDQFNVIHSVNDLKRFL